MTNIKGCPIGLDNSDEFAACKALTRSINNACNETPRYMGLRELVQNSIDAIIRQQRIEPGFHGRVVVAPFWDGYNQELTNKLCVADNGISMSIAEVQKHLNNLHNSGNDQGHEFSSGTAKHKGQGAKTALLPYNKLGMEYYLMQQNERPVFCNLWCNEKDYDEQPVYELQACTEDNGYFARAQESEMKTALTGRLK